MQEPTSGFVYDAAMTEGPRKVLLIGSAGWWLRELFKESQADVLQVLRVSEAVGMVGLDELFDIVVFQSTERRLGLSMLLKALQERGTKPTFFMLDGDEAHAASLSHGLNIPIHMVSADQRAQLMASLALRATPFDESQTLWDFNRGAFSALYGQRRTDSAWCVYSATTDPWPKDWNQVLTAIVRRAATVRHENLPIIEDIDATENSTMLLSHVGAGQPLPALLQRGRLPLDAALGLIGIICQVLEVAHNGPSKPLLYGHIGPEQLWIRSDGTPMLLHLGVSNVVNQLACNNKAFESESFANSPEQSQGQPPSPQSDVFYLASFLYELLAGRPPYLISDPERYMQALNRGAFDDIRDFRTDLSPPIIQAVHKSLAPDPTQRPQSPAELVAALQFDSKACRQALHALFSQG